MLLSKTPITPDEVSQFSSGKRGKLIGYEFADDEHPKTGIAYWQWFAVKNEGKVFIVEATPNGDHLEYTLAIVV